jgi:hypothetical protein
MSDLTGLPDFQAPTSVAQLAMFAPFGNGSYSVLPQQLVVAQGPEKRPRFELALVKCSDDFSEAGQYAVLDLALAGDFPVDEALTAARTQAADATVKPIVINSGFARLCSTSGTVTLPADLAAPVTLGWSGPDFARWTTRLSINAAELIKEALSGNTLLFGARVEFDLIGVSPRLTTMVEFEPTRLLEALLAGKPTREIAISDLHAIFSGSRDGLPLRVNGTLSGADADSFPQGMLDRVIAAYASLVPAPAPSDPPYVAFRNLGSLDAGTVHWDLSEAVAAPRAYVLTLDPLSGLRKAMTGDGGAALVKEITIPALNLGLERIDIAANLPVNRLGVPAVGVNIDIPANPPNRPDAITETILFAEPDDVGSVEFRLSPDEELSYTATCFALVAAGSSIHQYQSTPLSLSQNWLQLQAANFPVTFVHLTAAERLLNLASMTGTLTYSILGKAVVQPLKLNAAMPDTALALPNNATDATITLAAIPSDGGPGLNLPPMPPGRIRLDVTSFREYGPHTFTIRCDFGEETAPLTIDLLPEEKASDPSAAITIHLVPSRPCEKWGYTTSSPFRSGYRYRKSGDNTSDWSPVLSPFRPLTLKSDGTMILTP